MIDCLRVVATAQGYTGIAVRRFLRAQSGAASVEFALIAILAIPLLFGIFEVGRLCYNKATLEYLADEVVRAAAVHLDEAPVDGVFIAAAMSSGLDGFAQFLSLDDLSGDIETRSEEATLVLRYPHRIEIPLVFETTLELSAIRLMP